MSAYVQVMECIEEKQLAVDNLHRIHKRPGVNPKREWQKLQRHVYALTKHAI